ncbi:fumarylacetoacetate hydrolase family protein [Flavicella sediminum]|uniref:fumarylacetoacetate hydrolase family protein n=1 Tax=Flavicella sediminum TaxID=2585141 RepID=UPI001123983D|nr:fumarylacetoacetate hydrolase family protein [Flavicella sediminum]
MKILAIGKNYVNAIEEISAVKKGITVIFSKPESSLVTDNKDVVYPSFTNNLAYEIELVLKIGKTGKNISEKDALNHVSEIAVGIDYTAKDVMAKCRENSGPWELAKGFDGAAPISGFQDFSNFSDPSDINFDLKINGAQKQVGNTSHMIYNFSEIISYVSTYMTLEPGDLIFTGTPATGAGAILKGDRLQCSIEGKLLLDFKMV